jgi:class 3 adenylate cyclase
MLNKCLSLAIPSSVERLGGSIDRIIGDALTVVFNQRGDQPDHAQRAVRASMAIQEAAATGLSASTTCAVARLRPFCTATRMAARRASRPASVRMGSDLRGVQPGRRTNLRTPL